MTSQDDRERREAAARKYLPEQIDLLLVAEAPPAASDRYFYFEEVPKNDWLFRAVAESLLGKKPSRKEKASDLEELKNRGIFLIDVMLDPADGSKLTDHVPDLVRRCVALKPRRVILIKVSVYKAAYKPLEAADLPVINKKIDFPSTGRQKQFKRQFAEALQLTPETCPRRAD